MNHPHTPPATASSAASSSSSSAKPRTLYEKIFDSHLISEENDGTCLLYIDRHI
ncbi:3-isopropylmalate dehydratase, partial [Tilletia horrida]